MSKKRDKVIEKIKQYLDGDIEKLELSKVDYEVVLDSMIKLKQIEQMLGAKLYGKNM